MVDGYYTRFMFINLADLVGVFGGNFVGYDYKVLLLIEKLQKYVQKAISLTFWTCFIFRTYFLMPF